MDAANRKNEAKEKRLQALAIRQVLVPKSQFSKYCNQAVMVAQYRALGNIQRSISVGEKALADPGIEAKVGYYSRIEICLKMAQNYRDTSQLAKSMAMYDRAIPPMTHMQSPDIADVKQYSPILGSGRFYTSRGMGATGNSDRSNEKLPTKTVVTQEFSPADIV